MGSLMALLRTVLSNSNKSWLIQVLTGAGLGLATTASFTTFIDYYKLKTINELGQLGAVSGLLSIAGLDKAISIIIGAYMASVYINTFASSLKLIKNDTSYYRKSRLWQNVYCY